MAIQQAAAGAAAADDDDNPRAFAEAAAAVRPLAAELAAAVAVCLETSGVVVAVGLIPAEPKHHPSHLLLAWDAGLLLAVGCHQATAALLSQLLQMIRTQPSHLLLPQAWVVCLRVHAAAATVGQQLAVVPQLVAWVQEQRYDGNPCCFWHALHCCSWS